MIKLEYSSSSSRRFYISSEFEFCGRGLRKQTNSACGKEDKKNNKISHLQEREWSVRLLVFKPLDLCLRVAYFHHKK